MRKTMTIVAAAVLLGFATVTAGAHSMGGGGGGGWGGSGMRAGGVAMSRGASGGPAMSHAFSGGPARAWSGGTANHGVHHGRFARGFGGLYLYGGGPYLYGNYGDYGDYADYGYDTGGCLVPTPLGWISTCGYGY